METISTINKNTSLLLMYYAGNKWLNQSSKLDPVKTEYHKSIRIITPNVHRSSVDAMLNFNGFPYFDAIHSYLNAKTYSKIIRLNGNNGIRQYVPQMIKDWENWHNKNIAIFNNYSPLRTIPKKDKNNIALRWYISALSLNIQDVHLGIHGNHRKISSTHYVTKNIPTNVKFIPFDSPWTDDQMNDNDLYFFIDASVYFSAEDNTLDRKYMELVVL